MRTLISNNCVAASIYQKLKLRYDSPTIWLHILPEQYVKFCTNLEYYLKQPITPATLTDWHREKIAKLYWGQVPEFPYGLCDDILLIFQHYPDYETAAKAWARRVDRVDLDDIGFIFFARNEGQTPYLWDFIKQDFPHTAVFTENFDIDYPHARVDMGRYATFMDYDGDKMLYEKHFNIEKYMKGEKCFYL